MKSQEQWSREAILELKSNLERQRDRIYTLAKNLEKRALEELSASNEGELSAVRLHNADMASSGSDQDATLKIAAYEISAVRKIEKALERIHKGNFGICSTCQQCISKARLLASPEAEMCYRCQNNEEIEAKSRKRPHFADDSWWAFKDLA
jgi:RNA polymerase-binding transcription factor DksA